MSDEFYILSIERSPGFSGGALWWAPGETPDSGLGYVENIDRAGVYSQANAEKICGPSHGDSVAIPVEAVRRAAYLRVDWPRAQRLAAELEAEMAEELAAAGGGR